jgi:hypothetical protein
MTKLIAAFIIIVVLYGGWELFLYWDRIKNEEDTARKQAASAVVVPENLPGLPDKLQASLQTAREQGPAAFGAWLKTYGNMVQDPRKAWIELDYCIAIAREDPSEAKRVFGRVKDRTLASSPVWPRIQQLDKTYQ